MKHCFVEYLLTDLDVDLGRGVLQSSFLIRWQHFERTSPGLQALFPKTYSEKSTQRTQKKVHRVRAPDKFRSSE